MRLRKTVLTVTPLLKPLQVLFPDHFGSLPLACGIIKALGFIESQVPSTRQLTPLSPQRSPILNRPSAATRPTRAPMFLATTTATQSSSAPTVSDSIGTTLAQSRPLLPLPPPLIAVRPETDNSHSNNKTFDHLSDQHEDVVQILPARKRKRPFKVQNKSSDELSEDAIQVLPTRRRKPSAKIRDKTSSDEEVGAIQVAAARKRKRPAKLQ